MKYDEHTFSKKFIFGNLALEGGHLAGSAGNLSVLSRFFIQVYCHCAPEKGVQMSFSTILSAAIEGLTAEVVRVEADVSNGLPVFHMVGYLSSEVKEAGERVRTAIRNSGYDYPAKRTVINLSPATLRKRGASFDLPIAVAILASLGQIPSVRAEKCLIIGELSLDGRVRKVPGILPAAMTAFESGIRCCIIPKDNETEGALVKGLQVIGVENLQEAVDFLKGSRGYAVSDNGVRMITNTVCNVGKGEMKQGGPSFEPEGNSRYVPV